MIVNAHLRELGWNIFYWINSFCYCSIIFFIKKDFFVFFLLNCHGLLKISYFYLTEAFWTFLIFSCIFSFLINLPLCFCFIYLFFRSAFYSFQARRAGALLILGSGLNLVAYLYLILPFGIPLIFNFFKNFENFQVEYFPTLWNLFFFFFQMSLLLLIAINLPFLFSFFETHYLKNRYKYLIFLAFLIATLTPPDIFSFFLLLIPISLGIEFLIFIKHIVKKQESVGEYSPTLSCFLIKYLAIN